MATVEHCLFCFDTLAATLNHQTPLSLDQVQSLYKEYYASKKPSSLDPPSDPTAAPATAPLFVTWNIVEDDAEDEDEYDLRGCIGTFSAQPLADGLHDFALTAALRDSRFSPVRAKEVPRLAVAVTLLHDFEPAEGGPLDWTLGRHGVRCSFSGGPSDHRRYSATFLPDVPKEQGWTKQDTLEHLVVKAGWRRGVEALTSKGLLSITRYQGEKKGIRYGDYAAFRAWVKEVKKE